MVKKPEYVVKDSERVKGAYDVFRRSVWAGMSWFVMTYQDRETANQLVEFLNARVDMEPE